MYLIFAIQRHIYNTTESYWAICLQDNKIWLSARGSLKMRLSSAQVLPNKTEIFEVVLLNSQRIYSSSGDFTSNAHFFTTVVSATNIIHTFEHRSAEKRDGA